MTGHNIQQLAKGLESNVIKQGTDIFTNPTKEFAKNPELFLHLIKNPELFNFGELPEPIISNVARPTITRTMIGRSFSHLKLKETPTTKPCSAWSKVITYTP